MNFLTFVLIFVGFVALIYLLTSEDKEGDIDKYLSQNGYTFIKREGSNAASYLRIPTTFYYNQEERGIDLSIGERKYDETEDSYLIQMNAYVSIPIFFKIITPYQTKKETDQEPGNISGFLDLSIETYNPLQIQNLFSTEGFYEQIEGILSDCLRFEVSSVKDYVVEDNDVDQQEDTEGLVEVYELKIVAEITEKTGILEEVVDLGEEIIRIMRLKSQMIFELDKEGKYLCFNCHQEIPFEGAICEHCGTIAPKCVICFNDPEPDDEMLLFSCCKSYAHQDHARSWLESNSTCPYCSSDSPKLVKVSETEEFGSD